ncbi:MAG: TIGR03086 family metal-binding protein [Actinomycetes bacterium]
MTTTDVVELHRRSVERFADLVQQVRADQWDDPTPCSDWSVRDLVNHLVVEDRWTAPLMRGSTMAEVGDRLDGDLLGRDAVSAVIDAAKEAVYAVGEPGATDRVVHLSFGDAPGADYAWQLFADHLVHGWDLAKAIDVDDRLDPALVSALADWFAGVEETYRSMGAIGPRVTLPPDARAQDRLLAAFGRDPSWGRDAVLVRRFGAAFDRGDLDAIMSMMTEDCVFESTNPAPDGTRIEGAPAVRAAWERMFSETRAPRFETEAVVACGDRAVLQWVFHWQQSDGAPGHVRGVDVLRLRDGLVAEKLSYVKG